MAEPNRPAGARLADRTAAAKVLVRAAPDGRVAGTLGIPYGRASRDVPGMSAGTLVVGLLPGGWLLVAPPGSASVVVQHVEAGRADEFASVVDVTHGHTLMRLTGSDAAGVLAKLCSIDLADAATPDGAAVRTLVAGLTATVIRDDAGEPSYLLLCDRSFGRYLSDVLLDAGREFGIGAEGGPATDE